ncbi:MAG: hydrolase [Victivallaceae bacterium]|nr:hydrolase [Victivallaceae bacterium]
MIHRLESGNCCFVMIDMQEKLLKVMADAASCIEKHELLLKAAAILEIDGVATEQYPAGLGSTVDELKCLLPDNTPVIEKTTFSCWGESRFRTALKAKKRQTLIVCGIEAHVCVQQTVLELTAAGYEVAVPADALTSRRAGDYQSALAVMRQAGALVTSVEALIFMLLRDAKHPDFRAVAKLVK